MKPKIHKEYKRNRRVVLYNGDCLDLLTKIPRNSVSLTITSPPYCIGKAYDTSKSVDHFRSEHERIISRLIDITKDGGSICWQVGYHVGTRGLTPLDFHVHDIFSKSGQLNLRNRIIWTYGHGAHCSKRFSGRHEVLLWYTKGDEYYFDLDAVRVPQKYPGKRHYKGSKKGGFSGNPLGKNPSDVWDIPNVKANHVEKTEHPCQFPTELVRRIVKSTCPADEIVFDPYMGSGSSGVAAVIEDRKFLGAELNPEYYSIAEHRVADALNGRSKVRPLNKAIHMPDIRAAVARKPEHFKF